MLQTLETKLEKFPGMEEKTYKRWFPSTPTEMPIGTPRELPTVNSDNLEVDIFSKEETVLYTPPLKVYDFPTSGVQLHIHGSMNGNSIYGGGYKKYGEQKIFKPMNSYELAMADYQLQIAQVKPIMPKK